jgi:hypothetical protein
MSLLIDGYNLLHASGILGRGLGPGGLERSRSALLNFLVESLSEKELAHTVVVFDAGPPPHGRPRTVLHRGLTVRFSSNYENADALIEELIRQDSTPRRLTVVSSDHRLHKAARRRKATPIDSDKWFAQVVRDRIARAQGPPVKPLKPSEAPTAAEVKFWLQKFGFDESADAAEDGASNDDGEDRTSSTNPFPPGYGEDLLEEA